MKTWPSLGAVSNLLRRLGVVYTVAEGEAIVGDLRDAMVMDEGSRHNKHVKDLMALELEGKIGG